MALMGDSIDNIPGARDPNDKPAPGERRKAGIGEVGARQLIQQFGSAEEALRRAGEVKRASYREALEKCGEFVNSASSWRRSSRCPGSTRARSAEDPATASFRSARLVRRTWIHFPATRTSSRTCAGWRKTDYAAFDSHDEFVSFFKTTSPGAETSVWLSLDSKDPDEEGYGTFVSSVEISSKPGARAPWQTTPRIKIWPC